MRTIGSGNRLHWLQKEVASTFFLGFVEDSIPIALLLFGSVSFARANIAQHWGPFLLCVMTATTIRATDVLVNTFVA